MDPFSHALWGVVIFNKLNSRSMFWVMFFAVFPDLFSSIPFLVWRLFYFNFDLDIVFGNWLQFIPPAIFAVFQTAYDLAHSFIVFAAVFVLIFIWRRQKLKGIKLRSQLYRAMFTPILAWGLHILIDIFSHAGPGKGVRFLFPFSDFYFSVVNWDTMPFVIINAVVLGVVGSILFIHRLSTNHH